MNKTNNKQTNANATKKVGVKAEVTKEKMDDNKDILELTNLLQAEQDKNTLFTNMLQQLQADFDNYRKRNARLENDVRNKAQAETILALLPTYDALLSATLHITDPNTLEGLNMVQREFLSALANLGVTAIEAVGHQFDPNLHNALAMEESDQLSGVILEEIQKGFKNENGVIRYSLVKISK